jgi:hypothetical protein
MSSAGGLKVGIVADDKTKKGISSAEKNIIGLTKSVRNLGKTFASVFAVQQIANFGQAAVKAFMDDQKAAAQLSNTVKNLGLAFADADIQKFIEQLSLATGVVDDQLRPSMQKLLQVTGSVAKSQDLLKNAIDISRGSGVDLATVTSDLANAYVGNNKGLKKYALGLTNAELKTASFDKVLTAFNKNFSGASSAYLETYAGKMEKLTTAAGEAQEKIGGALIDALMNLSGSTGIDDLISKMNTLTDSVVGFIDKIGEGLGILNAIRKSSLWTMNKNIQQVQVDAYNRRLKRNYMNAWNGVDIPKTKEQIAAQKKAEAAAAKRAKEILAAQNKNTLELKKQAALKKAGTVFDLEQIQLVAALKGKLSEEEKLRVEAQLALLNGNEAVATKLTNQILAAQDATGSLSKFLTALPNARNPFEYLDAYLSYLAGKAASIITGQAAPNAPSGTATPAPMPSTNVSAVEPMISYNVMTGLSYNPNANQPVINVTVQGSVIKEQELIAQIQNGTQLASLSGSPSQIGRIAGMFG